LAVASSKQNADLRTLAREALEAFESGHFELAGGLYQRLEQQDPSDPEWPRRLASLHQQRGHADDELDALVRCADRQSAQQDLLAAIATYRMILSIDPEHLLAQQRLGQLQPNNTVSVLYLDDRRGAAPATQTAQGPRLAASSSPESVDSRAALEPLEEDTLERITQLSQSSLFRCLDKRSLVELAEQIRTVELPAGEELFHQGDPAGALYLVTQGAVVPIAEGEPRTRLAVLEAGEFFGEIALFTNQPRNATVEALVDCRLLSIDRSVLSSLLARHPQALLQLQQRVQERLIQRLVRTSPLFQIFSLAKRWAIAKRFRFLEVVDGHCVVEQHHPSEEIFILLSGQLEVVHCKEASDHQQEPSAEERLTTLEPGEMFGETSLLWKQPAHASVVARGKCWLLALPAWSFQEMLEHHPELAVQASRLARERREQSRRPLREPLRR
jgi:cAMP-dependent protein kinase regulator